MIFASDLDGTLIYSNRLLSKEPVDVPVRNVERYNGREITFMTEKAIALLKELTDRMLFVPVTTRTVEQYNRIHLFQNEIRPSYAITCNGGVVLKDGRVDADWQDHISAKINRSPVTVKDIKRKIEETSDASWLETIRVVDQFFIYLIIKPEAIPATQIANYSEWAVANDWVLSVQGRKVYFIPSFINKWDAVDYVAEKEGKKIVFTAGDSHLDVCLIEQSQFGLIPRHGEAAAAYGHLGMTQKTGIWAAEEILETILSKQLESTLIRR